jgi:hypothetical protein
VGSVFLDADVIASSIRLCKREYERVARFDECLREYATLGMNWRRYGPNRHFSWIDLLKSITWCLARRPLPPGRSNDFLPWLLDLFVWDCNVMCGNNGKSYVYPYIVTYPDIKTYTLLRNLFAAGLLLDERGMDECGISKDIHRDLVRSTWTKVAFLMEINRGKPKRALPSGADYFPSLREARLAARKDRGPEPWLHDKKHPISVWLRNMYTYKVVATVWSCPVCGEVSENSILLRHHMGSLHPWFLTVVSPAG